MICIIKGTNRPQSNTGKVAAVVQGIYQDLNADPQLLDLEELPAAMFAPASYAEKPAALQPFTEKVLESSALVVITPEYNGGFPGVLKYFIDMLPFPESFERKPVCFIGLSAGYYGALRPVEQLQQIFSYRNAHIFPQRVFIPGISEKINQQDELTDDEIKQRLQDQAEGFLKFITSLRQPGG